MAAGGGGGGFGAGSNNNGSRDTTPPTLADAEKNIADVLNGERGGGGSGNAAPGGAGGFSGYGTGSDAINLSRYLPGGSRDPRRQLASVTKKKTNEIASIHDDIFGIITKRFKILCKLKEIRDCD